MASTAADFRHDRAMETDIKRSGRPYAWYVLALLFTVYVMNFADRQIVAILAEDIKRDMGLSDAQVGLLTGPAIGFFYAVLGVPMAYVADRVNRVRFIAVCLSIWSVMTIFGGRAQNLVQLALTRVGVSIAEAGGTPSSVSLVADYFPPKRRGTAMAIWTAGSTVGMFFGFALGGVINEAIGWRNAFLVAGIPGVVLAILLLLTLREPVRGQADTKPAETAPARSLIETLRYLWGIRLFRWMVIAGTCCNVTNSAVLSWAAPFAVRTFKVGSAEAGAVMGTGIMLAGGAALVLSGIATDFLGRKGLHRPAIAVAAMMTLSALLFALAFFVAGDIRSFGLFYAAGYAAMICNPAITWVILQQSSPPHMRAMATAIMLLTYNLAAHVPTPLIIGLVSDALRASFGSGSLRIALAIAPVAAIVAAVAFLYVARIAWIQKEVADGSPAMGG